MKNYKAAVDIGGTKVTASLADMEGFIMPIYLTPNKGIINPKEQRKRISRHSLL